MWLLLLLVGWYLIDNRFLSTLCLILCLVFSGVLVVQAFLSKEWTQLLFPTMALLLWFVVREVLGE